MADGGRCDLPIRCLLNRGGMAGEKLRRAGFPQVNRLLAHAYFVGQCLSTAANFNRAFDRVHI